MNDNQLRAKKDALAGKNPILRNAEYWKAYDSEKKRMQREQQQRELAAARREQRKSNQK